MSTARLILIVVPLVLIPTMAAAFPACVSRWGFRRGYFAAFCIYWFVWCLAIPWSAFGREIFGLFRATPRPFGSPAALGMLALAAPLCLGFGYAFPKAIRQADAAVVLLSAGIAAVNAPLEELLWRGAYLGVFPDDWLLGYVYPSIGFALWHLAPLRVAPNRAPGGNWSFVLVSGLVGCLWGWVARTSGSILWTAAAHVLFDFSGLGASIYVRRPRGGA
jgi:membrane protease YdiL (CAAX protease family)